MCASLSQASRAFPGFSHLFNLGGGAGNGFRVSLNLDESEDDFAILAGVQPKKPLEGRWVMGKKNAQDVIWTTHAIFVIMSERVITRLKEEGYTGWNAIPISILDKQGTQLSSYYLLQVTGRCGGLDDSRSIEFMKQLNSDGRQLPMLRGLYFDESTWDGSDFFQPIGTAYILITKSVMECLKDVARGGDIVLTSLDEHESMPL
jgi:hypothetical protein